MSDPLVGSVLAGYRIVAVVGRGGMGVVYEAVELGLDRPVALKVIAPELAADPGYRERFVAESRVAASIDHPNVVPIFRAGEEDGRLFLAMRFVQGDDLGAVVRRDGPLEPVRAARIVAQVAAALEAAHARGLVHRDVKPANVLIAADDHVYLTDYGLAKRVAAVTGPTRAGMVVGTPDYLAPEQIRGEQVGPWTDIYALGCVLFFVLSGRVVFALDEIEAKLWAHLSEPPPAVSALRDDVSGMLDGIVARALAKAPRERFASASALADALEAAAVELRSQPALAATPLVGRTRELATLHALWAAVERDGVGRRVLVTGARGVGKTRLAAAFASEAGEDGDVLQAAGDGSTGTALAFVAGAAGARRRTLLVVDDLDRSGDGVHDAVEALRLTELPLLVLVTAVDEHAIRRRGADAWLTLAGLDLDAAGEIVRLYAGGGRADAALVARLLAASDGLPGRLHQLAREWAREDAAGRVEDSATRAIAGRREWRGAERDLADDIMEFQATQERAEIAAGRARSGRGSVACPFKGLASFDFDDAEFFFGRERIVAGLVARAVGAPLLGIVGASGSGKSSLLRAGLLPALASGVLPGSERWARVLIRPGEHPAQELHKASAYTHPDQPVVLAVDQFEETFTACRDEEERRAFVDGLTRAARGDALRGALIVAVRSDFYPRCAAYPEFSELLAANHVVVGPMRRDELREAIERPATRAGLRVEPELVDRLLADVESEPGGLPLLSTALLELWQHRDGDWLRTPVYERTGGVSGAVARLAEEAFGRLEPADQAVARRVLLRLAGDEGGNAVARNRVPLAELGAPEDDTRRVIGLLADRRLLTISSGTVEVAHEALLREWPRLRDWLEQDAEGRRLHRHLTHAARAWDERGRDPGDLYRGGRLATALEWQGEHELEPNATERAFLDDARAAAQSELDTARRRTRRLQGVALGLAFLVALTGASAILAVRQTRRADAERRTAISRSLANQALAQRGQAPDVAALLGLEAYRAGATVEARGALSTILRARTHSLGSLRGHVGPINEVAASPDGETLVSAGVDGTVRFWSTRTRRRLGRPLRASARFATAVAYSPDGELVAVGSADGRVRLWDVRTRRQIGRPLEGHRGFVANVAFSPDSRQLASGGEDTTVRLWDVSSGRPLGRPLTAHTDTILTVAFSPDGGTLASAGNDATVQLWDIADRRRLGQLPAGHTDGIYSVAFSPDGRTLASAGLDATIRLWDLSRRRPLGQPLTGHAEAVTSVAFSPDGRTLASGSDDATIRLWDVPTRRPLGPPLQGHRGYVASVRFAAGGNVLASAGEDATVRLWDVRTRGELGDPLVRHTDRITAVAFGADGLLASAGQDGSVRLWDQRTRRALGQLPKSYIGYVTRLAFHPDGHTLAVASQDATIRLWDVGTRRELGPPVRGHTSLVHSLAFSADGQRLASAGPDGTIRVWDPRSGRQLERPLIGHTSLTAMASSRDGRSFVSAGEDAKLRVWDLRRDRAGRPLSGHVGPVWGVAMSPDGKTLASAGEDETVRLWDATSGRELGQPLTSHTGVVNSVAFSPDGETLASTSADGTVRLWDVPSRRPLGEPLTGHSGAVTGVAFSPDGRTLASAGDDGTVRVWRRILWNNRQRVLEDLVCAAVGRSFTKAEWTEFLPDQPYHETCPRR